MFGSRHRSDAVLAEIREGRLRTDAVLAELREGRLRSDAVLAEMREGRGRSDALVADVREEVRLTREEVRLSREERAESREFMRQLTLRAEKANREAIAELRDLRRGSEEHRAETADLRAESRAQTQALLRMIDRLGPGPATAG